MYMVFYLLLFVFHKFVFKAKLKTMCIMQLLKYFKHTYTLSLYIIEYIPLYDDDKLN